MPKRRAGQKEASTHSGRGRTALWPGRPRFPREQRRPRYVQSGCESTGQPTSRCPQGAGQPPFGATKSDSSPCCRLEGVEYTCSWTGSDGVQTEEIIVRAGLQSS